jgi:hypothetical protein
VCHVLGRRLEGERESIELRDLVSVYSEPSLEPGAASVYAVYGS